MSIYKPDPAFAPVGRPASNLAACHSLTFMLFRGKPFHGAALFFKLTRYRKLLTGDGSDMVSARQNFSAAASARGSQAG